LDRLRLVLLVLIEKDFQQQGTGACSRMESEVQN